MQVAVLAKEAFKMNFKNDNNLKNRMILHQLSKRRKTGKEIENKKAENTLVAWLSASQGC